MDKKIYKVNAFAEMLGGGNPAGVLPNADGLSTEDMQKIAKRMNLSETAFVLTGGEGYDFEVRFFTPTEEVDLCGHATIATFSTLKTLGLIDKDKMTLIQKTKAGLLAIELADDSSVLMRQANPINVKKDIPLERLYEAMDINENQVGINNIMEFPEIWSTGLADILLPVETIEVLKKLSPKMEALATISNELGVTGVHAYAIDETNQIWCRNFAPACGINEESATGTSNGALGAYLHLNPYKNKKEFSFTAYQGDWMDKPSRINVYTKQRTVLEVWVGGKAMISAEGVISLPEFELNLKKYSNTINS